MKSSNPVLSRLGQAAERERTAAYGPAGHGQPGYGQPGYGQPAPGAPYHLGEYTLGQAPTVGRTMTVDDVVVRTVTLVGTTALTAAIAWNVVPLPATFATLLGALFVGVILGMVITFAQITNPAILLTYAVVEGVFVGMVSKAYEYAFDGIVLQAVIATLGVFLLMAVLYKSKVIRATPKFVRVMTGIVTGLCVIMLVNMVMWFGFHTVSPLRDGSPLAIGFSLVCIVVASLMFVIYFQQAEDGVRAGLPERYAWLSAFGILVGLVWLYLEILRLLSYLQGDD